MTLFDAANLFLTISRPIWGWPVWVQIMNTWQHLRSLFLLESDEFFGISALARQNRQISADEARDTSTRANSRFAPANPPVLRRITLIVWSLLRFRIRHENKAFQKRSSNLRNLKTPALRFKCGRVTFWKRWLLDNHVINPIPRGWNQAVLSTFR